MITIPPIGLYLRGRKLLSGRPGDWIHEPFPRLFVVYQGAQVFVSPLEDTLFPALNANDNHEAP